MPYVYSHLIDIDFTGLVGTPIAGPILIKAGQPYEVRPVREVYRSPLEKIAGTMEPEPKYNYIGAELVANDLLERARGMGLVRLAGAVPTKQEIHESRKGNLMFAAKVVKNYESNYNMAMARGVPVPTPSDQTVQMAMLLRRQAPKFFQSFGVPGRILELIIGLSGDEDEVFDIEFAGTKPQEVTAPPKRRRDVVITETGKVDVVQV